MKSVEIGSNGAQVPVMAYGTYHLLDKLDPYSAFNSLGEAFDAGVRMFETADNYPAAELVIGNAVSEGVLPRGEIFVAGKTGIPSSWYEASEGRERMHWTSPERIRVKVDEGLWQLGVDNYDLFQLHMTNVFDGYDERAEAMTGLIEEGKIMDWGVSNVDADQLRAMLDICDSQGLRRPVSVQNLGNMLGVAGVDAVNMALDEDMTFLAYTPLLHGALTDQTLEAIRGYIRRGREKGQDIPEQDGPLVDAVGELTMIQDYARDRGKSLAQFALAYMAMHSGTVVLNGMTRSAYIHEAVDAADWEIDEEGMELLRGIQGRPDLREINSDLVAIMDIIKPYYKKL